LRAITVYAELLERKYSREHDEDFAMFAGNLVQGATRRRLSSATSCQREPKTDRVPPVNISFT
jgi:hypothetical protein